MLPALATAMERLTGQAPAIGASNTGSFNPYFAQNLSARSNGESGSINSAFPSGIRDGARLGSPYFPPTPDASQSSLAGYLNAFVTELNPAGTALVPDQQAIESRNFCSQFSDALPEANPVA